MVVQKHSDSDRTAVVDAAIERSVTFERGFGRFVLGSIGKRTQR
jgi:hypothetical protein